MYITVCIKENDKFKRGELYDTYQKLDSGCYVRKKGSKDEYTNLPFLEYRDFFMQVSDCYLLPKARIDEIHYGFLHLQTRKELSTIDEFYQFDTDYDSLVKINLEILYRLNTLKKLGPDEVISEPIHVLLKEIQFKCKYNSFEQMNDLIQDIKKQISENEVVLLLKLKNH